MQKTILYVCISSWLLIGCNKKDNPVDSQPKDIQIKNIGWVYTNNPPDILNGYLQLDVDITYSGDMLQPNDVSSFKITSSGITWNVPISSANLSSSGNEIVQGLYATIVSNGSVMPMDTFQFDLKLKNGSDALKQAIFPAPGFTSSAGFKYIYTEDYSGQIPNSFARMIRRPSVSSLSKSSDTVTVQFTINDSLCYNGYVLLFNSSGAYIGHSALFRNVTTKALTAALNHGAGFYIAASSINTVTLTSSLCDIASPAKFNDIYSVRVVVTDGSQYANVYGTGFDCRAISLPAYL